MNARTGAGSHGGRDENAYCCTVALRGVSLTVVPWPGRCRHRPERLRQVDAASRRGRDPPPAGGATVLLLGAGCAGARRGRAHEAAASPRRARPAVGKLVPDLSVLENVALPLLLDGHEREPAFLPRRRNGSGVPVSKRATPRSRPSCRAARRSGSRSPARSSPGPAVLFADEPTGSMDTLGGEQLAQTAARRGARAQSRRRARDPRQRDRRERRPRGAPARRSRRDDGGAADEGRSTAIGARPAAPGRGRAPALRVDRSLDLGCRRAGCWRGRIHGCAWGLAMGGV